MGFRRKSWGGAVLALALTGCVDAQETFPASPEDAEPAAADGRVEVDLALMDAGPDQALDQAVDQAVDQAPPDQAPPPPDAGPPDEGPPDAEPADAAVLADLGPPPCVPALTVTPDRTFARPFDLVTFQARGGTGAWRFALAEDASGALLEPLTGAYLAGPTVGAVDRIVVTDDGCVGEAVATVGVVEAMEVHPAGGQVPVGAAFQFEVARGSGSFRFEMLDPGSGGRIDGMGAYRAGPQPGVDRLRIADAFTGEALTVSLDVRSDLSLQADPPEVVLPVGVARPITVQGGTDGFEAVLAGDGVVYEDGLLRAVAPGRATVQITDRFTRLSGTLTVQAVAALPAPLRAAGQGKLAGRLLAAGDLNGDGFDDVIYGWPDGDVGAGDGGAVLVYAGSAEGLRPEPAQIIAGEERREELGRGVAVGDFTGDGVPDLAVSAYLADAGAGDAGAVQLFRGLADGFFEDAPFATLAGIRGSDQLGMDVVLCDFNGDGRLDLAAGARLYEDRDLQNSGNQGGVLVWLGYEDGFLRRPDQILLGQEPDGRGGFVPSPEMRLGSYGLSAGDMDGDGRCELVAQGDEYRLAPGRAGADGVVLVFQGRAPNDLGPGGLSPAPVLGVVPLDTHVNSRLGRRTAVADLDGDGRAELVLGHYLYDDNGDNNPGAVHVFRGRDFDGPLAALVTTEAADRTYAGTPGDQLGWWVSVEDATGDGRPDLLAGALYGEGEGLPGNTGTVVVYAGLPDALPALEPTRVLAGVAGGDLFGHTAAAVDANGDGVMELVVADDRSDQAAPDAGALAWYDAADGRTELALPYAPSALFLGEGVAALPDVTGDGVPEALVGAPFHAFQTTGTRGGSAWLFPGGLGAEAPLALEGFNQHSGYDLLGWRVGSAGDFDGDGHGDFAVVGRSDERPGGIPGIFVRDGDCLPRRNDGGAIYIFRGGPAVDAQPDWVYYHDVTGANLHELAATDVNGDGRSDLILGSHFWDADGGNDAGGAVIILGRGPAGEGQVQMICDTAWQATGGTVSEHLGRRVAALGDLDGDGCGEVAIGVPLYDPPGRANAGAVYLVRGFGGRGCPANAQVVRIVANDANAQFGTSVAAGDLDGDGVPELAVGGIGLQSNGVGAGGVWVLPGTWLAALEGEAFDDAPEVALGDADGQVLTGRVAGERFGAAVAIGGGLLAVGTPLTDEEGVPGVGGVNIYRRGAGGLIRVARMAGETWRPGGRLGEQISAAEGPDGVLFVVGGFEAIGLAQDAGAAYGFVLPAAR
ncbi:MAG: FG-GAP repeat protein [Myxococcales bacterium]|nr:FG-GAP repeat protein [Myxococcales bacterium]